MKKLFGGSSSKRKKLTVPREPSPEPPSPNPSDNEEEMEDTLSFFQNTPILDPQPPGDNLGILFTSLEQFETFTRLRKRQVWNTRWYNREDMEQLGIHDGIVALYKNIGWHGVLEWQEPGLERLTLEFLSSLTLSEEDYYFRAYNNWFKVTTQQVCSFANAPSTGAMPDVATSDLGFFWGRITNSTFNIKHLKSSNIIHPTLKVAARLLTGTLFGKDELGTLSVEELRYLYLMVHRSSTKPDFGLFLLQRLAVIKGGKKAKTPLHVSGLISMIVRSLGIHFQPDRSLNTEKSMGLTNLLRGHLLEVRTDKYVWNVGTDKEPFLEVQKNNKGVLKLKRNIGNTDWKFSDIDDNLQEEDAGGDQTMGEPGSSTQAHGTQHDQWYHPNENWYSSMNTNYQNLHTDYQALNNNLQAMNNTLTNLDREFRDERTASQRFRETYQQQYDNQQSMIESLFNWHISEHPGYAPQQPPPPP